MDCWHCSQSARGVCRFCGRAVCRDHAQEHPYILDLYRARSGKGLKVLVVEDALYCGVCTPRPEPIDLPDLE